MRIVFSLAGNRAPGNPVLTKTIRIPAGLGQYFVWYVWEDIFTVKAWRVRNGALLQVSYSMSRVMGRDFYNNRVWFERPWAGRILWHVRATPIKSSVSIEELVSLLSMRATRIGGGQIDTALVEVIMMGIDEAGRLALEVDKDLAVLEGYTAMSGAYKLSSLDTLLEEVKKARRRLATVERMLASRMRASKGHEFYITN